MGKNFYSPSMLKKYLSCKHIIFNEKNENRLKLKRKPHSNIDLLSYKIRNQYNNESFIAINNLYAENQLLISIYSHDATKLLFDMNSKKNWIIDTIDENIKL